MNFIRWWPDLLEHLTYLSSGFSCFCWIGHYNIHKTNYCQNYLREKESAVTLKMMDWPPQSPDLNPIEQIWGEEIYWQYTRDMCCCNCCKRGACQILKLKVDKTVRLASSGICCAQSNHLHVSWTSWNEIMFWRQKRSIFSDLSGVLIFLPTTVYINIVTFFTFENSFII